ncbi:MAG: Fe-S cluster assembly ATPase SufC [Candidatus Curtissbacteria bacterium]|nr:Fe-S cluster assembly ATPase SufC [Candidatus Curtissbacteria bacterium]
MLKVKNLKASIVDKEILKGVDLSVGSGQLHVIMGPNGSGKSTLSQVIAGHPSYVVNGGTISVNGKRVNKLTPDKRAKLGVFLGFQHPVEVPGVSVFSFLRKARQGVILSEAKNLRNGKGKILHSVQDDKGLSKLAEFRQELLEYASSLKFSDDFLRRSLNEGFSGGEKKRNEILQMMALKPKLVILDEIDSGLDIDALRLVAEAIKKFRRENPKSSVVLITHYARILKYLKADFVHVMVDGKIIKSGKQKLAQEIEEDGYQKFQADRHPGVATATIGSKEEILSLRSRMTKKGEQ